MAYSTLEGWVLPHGLMLSCAVHVLICLCLGSRLSVEILFGAMSLCVWMHTAQQLTFRGHVASKKQRLRV